jgi:hypothetical protein
LNITSLAWSTIDHPLIVCFYHLGEMHKQERPTGNSNEVKSEKERGPKESWKDLAKEAETLEDNFINHGDGLVNDKSRGKDGKVDNSGDLVACNEDKR